MHYTDQQTLILALQNSPAIAQDSDHWDLIETHISWVLLRGPYAYKIKKALDLGFLDFTTLQKRRFYCEEELRLNSRLAPQLYLEVVPVTGSVQQPELGGPGKVLEYCVKMRRFPQEALLGDMVEHGLLQAKQIDQLIGQVAGFHLNVPSASKGVFHGDPEHVHAPALENFDQIRERTDAPRHVAWLGLLERWTNREYQQVFQQFALRKQQGFVRECHGDMHLGNIAMVDDVPVIFDGIEFNPDLYWIDVMSEVAFLFMDLEDHGKRQFAFRFLNGYLELTGDYSGLRVFHYYLAYRATVRAKVAGIRLSQGQEAEAQSSSLRIFERYLQLALSYTQPQTPLLLITHGLSGSGKSTLSAPLAESMGAIRIRSDRERQRIFGKGKRDGQASSIDAGVYSSDATGQTYAVLRNLANQVLQSGYPVIVDATFLERAQRDLFRQLAESLSVPLRILFFHAEAAVLRQRIEARRNEALDISEADLGVLEHQLDTYGGLDPDERDDTIFIDTESRCGTGDIVTLIRQSTGSE